jgi:hypothetical protein
MPPPPDSVDLMRASSALPGSAGGIDVLGAMQLPAAGAMSSFDGLLPNSLADAQVWHDSTCQPSWLAQHLLT